MALEISVENWTGEAKSQIKKRYISYEKPILELIDTLKYVKENDEVQKLTMLMYEMLGGFYKSDSESAMANMPDEFVGSMCFSLEDRYRNGKIKSTEYHKKAADLAVKLNIPEIARHNYQKAGEEELAKKYVLEKV